MKRNVLKFISVLLSLILLFSCAPLSIFATSGTAIAEVWVNGELKASSASSISDMWAKAISLAPLKTDSGEKSEVVFKLLSDWTAASGSFGKGEAFRSGALLIPENKIITMDLGGNILNRGLSSPTIDGMVIYMAKGSYLTVNDSDSEKINKGALSDGLWRSDKNGTTEIKGGIITGGYNRTDGGAVYMEERTVLTLNGGTICGNTADDGGGVQIEGNTSKLQMSEKAFISYNKAYGSTYGGGGICTDGTGVTVAGGNVTFNSAKYGGGIYCYNDSVSIVGVKINNNSATLDGGAVYPQGTSVSLSSCELTDNSAGRNGGAVYVYTTGTSLTDTVIEKNTAKAQGDGVYVSEDCDLSVSGKMIIKNNGEENLFLEGNDDLYASSLSRGSEVYISIGGDLSSFTGPSNPFVSSTADTRPEYFFSDKEGYYVSRQNDPTQKNYRYLYFEAGQRPKKNSETIKSSSVNTAYGTYEGDNGTYGLYKGNFEYASVLDSENNYAPVFYYSDGYFDSDPKKYNSHLATMSLSIAMSAFAKNTTEEDRYYNQFGNAKQLLADIGCNDENIYINDDYTKKPAYFGKDGERLSTIGVIIANKKIKIADKEYTLIPLAVRGAGYEIEWGSNATVGTSGESKGFADAATQTFNQLEQYIKDYGLENEVKNGNVKFWLMGYSRASVTANITAKRLIDKYGQNNDIYGYCFEVPQGGSNEAALKEEWTDSGEYHSIHNVINKADFVTMLMPTEMGIKRYGIDHYVPGDPNLYSSPESKTESYNGGAVTTVSDNSYDGYEVSHNPESLYFRQRQLMLSQLQAVNPDLQFEDYFHDATINYIGYVTGLKDLLGEIPSRGTTPDDFVLDFYGKLQQWALCNDEVSNYREYFTTYKPWSADSWGADKPQSLGYFESEMTVEDAVVVAIKLIFGKSDEETGAIIDILLESALGISAVDFENISLLEVYTSYLRQWHTKTRAEKVEMGNALIEALLKERYPGADTIFDYLSEEEAEEIMEALPVLLDLALTFAATDYNTGDIEESQYYLGTFAYNMNTLISAHYPEINLAWLRSYDSFFENDTTAFTIEADSAQTPSGTFTADGVLTLSAAPGSAVYYSDDDGATYRLYRRSGIIDTSSQQIKAYAVSYGVKSSEAVITKDISAPETTLLTDETTVSSENQQGGSAFSGYIIPCLAALILLVGIVLIILRKKKA